MNISWWITHWAGWSPDRTALRFERREIGYGELEARVARLAGGFVSAGVRGGDRVAYLGANSPELLETLFAAARIGAVFVPLNARMPPAELRMFVGQSDPRLLVAEEGFGEAARASAPDLVDEAIVLFSANGGVPLAERGTPVPADPEDDGRRPVLIAYTSGTSGTPKGAVLSHDALTANALNAIAAFGITSEDEVVTAAPMFHVGGLNIHTTPAIRAGATVTVHRRFDPGLALEEIPRVGATLLVAVPAMSLAMMADPAWAATELGSLRLVATGSTFVPEGAISPWLERGVPVLQVYGLTETSPIATVVPRHEARRKGATAGKPVLDCRVAVVDVSARELPTGELGEVVIRGPNVMQEYWRNPDATRTAFVDGWFRSGDAGFFDEDGFLHVVDRLKDIIVVGGSNVYPADLEYVLAESADVLEAAVVGRPDRQLGEVPVAFVVPAPRRSPTREDVLGLFEHRLAEYKHPRDVIFLERLPRSPLGKVQKHALRALFR